MRVAMYSLVSVLLVGSVSWAQSVEPANWGRRAVVVPPNCPPGTPGIPTVPDPNNPQSNVPPGTNPANPNPAQPPSTDAFAQAGEGGTAAASAFAPGFFGDLIGYTGTRVISNGHGGTALVRAPILAHSGGIKIAEYESPRPVDRVYYAFNYYSDAAHSVNPGLPNFDVVSNLIGFEKTFLNGDASFGMRLPFVRISGVAGADESQVGDLALVFKYALYNNRATGDIVSGGLVLTVPTGGGITVAVPDQPGGGISGYTTQTFYSVVFQPYAGWIRTVSERWYLQGFHSFIVPTDSRDVTILANDLSVGYWLYRNRNDRFIEGVIPTFEVHVNTPLNHRGSESIPIGFADQCNLTFGTYVLFPRSVLGLAVTIPLVGPTPFSVESAANFTFRF